MTLYKQHTGQYAVRIRKWNGVKQEHIATIPLRTTKKDKSLERLSELKKDNRDNKRGIILPCQF